MTTTKHFHQRMKQRGITKSIIDCVIEFGEIDQDAYVLNQRMTNQHIKQIKHEIKKRGLV